MWEEIAYGQTDGHTLTNYYIDRLKSKLEKIIGIEKHAGKVRKKINHFHMA